MRLLPVLAALVAPLAMTTIARAQDAQHVTVDKAADGWRLRVDGEVTFLHGMNWGYVPVGQNYGYVFWSQPDDFIEATLRREMALLRGMGVNTIRQYPGIPPRWVRFIHDEFGIYTLINPLVGRYGATIDGAFVPVTNYADPRTREVLTQQTLDVVEEYRGVRGVLGYLLGNEANYGLSWTSFEIQALPEGERDAAKARALYSLYGEITERIHAADPRHPVALCNGDVQYIDIIAEEAGNIDIFATNVYRGRSGRDLYEVVQDKLDKPIFYSEFGADAYDAKGRREDHLTQASYLRDQWEEVYLEAAGNERHGNVLGGYIFQWSDGWWKYKQEENLDVHDTNASWPNKAYIEDYVEGRNNMNEEWFGITAKVPPDPDGTFEVQPRSAYFLLRDAFRLDPYEATPDQIQAHFEALEPADYAAEVAAFKALAGVQGRALELSYARVDLSMTSAAGTYKNGRGPLHASVDHTESVYLGGAVQPVDNLRAEAIVNVLGNVSTNPIDNIRYENRGARAPSDEGISASQLDRVQLYQASIDWNTDDFELAAFYRTGHFHWGYEGDFFGLYPEANYGPNLDAYNGIAPIGVEVTGKGRFDGLAFAIGPQLWWGANPAALARASRDLAGGRWTLVHHEDFGTAGSVATTAAVSEQVTRRTALAGDYAVGHGWNLEVGGLFSGSNKVGQSFVYTVDADGEPTYQDSGEHVIEDVIRWQDTLGGKVRLSRLEAKVRYLVEGGYQGLVADGGWDARLQNTGWTLTPVGRGNHWHANAGVLFPVGSFQVGPNVLVQKPLIGPNAPIGDAVDADATWYYPSVTARNFRDDPFAVLENRETYGGELLLVYDPTPGSYFFAWDNLRREDAGFAASLDFVYRHQPTVRDANFGFTAEGVLFAFSASPPASDEWTVNGRLMFGGGDARVIVQPYVGQQQARGDDPRLVTRTGVDARAMWRSMALSGFVRVNDWGPYDFYRDYNLTFPLQTMLDLSGGIGRADPFDLSTRIGVRAKYRLLDAFSPVQAGDVDPGIGNASGWEGEVMTYLRVMR